MLTNIRHNSEITPAESRSSRSTARSTAAGIVAIAFAFATAFTDADSARAAGTPTVIVQSAPAEGGTITVSGTGFEGTGAGIYLGVGPSGLAGFYSASGQLLDGNTIWIGPGLTEDSTGAQRTAPLAADGTFSVTVTVPAEDSSGVGLSVYTSLAHGVGAQDRSRDTVTSIRYAAVPEGSTEPEAPTDPASPTGPEAPTAPGTPAVPGTNGALNVPAGATSTPSPACAARAVNNGTLSWGIKSGFRDYIVGGIAKGSWTLSNVSYSGGQFGWSGGTGSVNTSTTQGIARFGGSVAFEGHNGALQVSVSNLRLQLESASRATVFADVTSTSIAGKKSSLTGVAFATVSLTSKPASGSTITIDSAPAVLTAAGASAFAGFYEAGTALDPISARLPLGATVPCDAFTSAELARTGSGTESTPYVATLAAVLLVAGAGVVGVSRRRSRMKARIHADQD